ncbi:LysM and putative peptidoglycan-binding domain-containing protein 3 [Orchesella cincta]|uniref:LysM and putative peptidoglycan-binding domain-containing protein 3 n=1 Tax=Orchesella cincta TaxID=48709 RepID=A0A1D2NF96_ORCCI|nr:LysM and putative peptidoglycan-binding domain-containing protein 3 [Orchesella cincta]
MAKRVDKSRFELEELGYRRIEDEFLERLVLPTDTLQGVALLYNTTVAELKKVNHIVSESELHARRVIKVPSKGILVDLTEDVAKPSNKTDVGSAIATIDLDVASEEDDQDNNGHHI